MSEDANAQDSSHSSKSTKKACNSYYYWHGHEKERAKVGDVAPMPTPVIVSRDNAATFTALEIMMAPKYSWCDGEKKVSVYVDTLKDETEKLDAESVQVEFKCNAFRVEFTTQTTGGKMQQRRLHLQLSKHVNASACSYKIKPATQQVVLLLTKAEPLRWVELVGTAAEVFTDEDKDDSDVK